MEAEEGAIVASDLSMTTLPVAPAPHLRPHGERGAGRVRAGTCTVHAECDRYEAFKVK